ncbi:unnamed protein product [Porites evermanni]|uniref:PID domain-containing protein n=1 Tax=Porites evermanni TaxID=104178 RepID=A0ABN8MCF5_9CNID|nr:unnamed protein product [Porites evermanni]
MIRLFSCRPLRARFNSDGDAGWDYHTVDLSIHTPTYSVKYLGCERLCSPGVSEICDTVKAIFASKKSTLKSLDHYSLKLTKQELSLRDSDSTEDEEKVFLLRKIRFSGVYKANQRVFFFTYQFGTKAEVLECNAVLCKNNNEAKSLAKVINKAFGDARSEFHQQEVANRRLHHEGLSENSMSALHVDVISNVDANRLYYNMNVFKNSRSNSAASAISSRGRTPDRLKQSNQSCHLGASIEWERTESSQDTRQSDVEKTSTSGELFGCTCEKECLLKEDEKPEETTEVIEKPPEQENLTETVNEPAFEMEIKHSPSSSSIEEELTDVENTCTDGHNCERSCDWSSVSGLEETEI